MTGCDAGVVVCLRGKCVTYTHDPLHVVRVFGFDDFDVLADSVEGAW